VYAISKKFLNWRALYLSNWCTARLL